MCINGAERDILQMVVVQEIRASISTNINIFNSFEYMHVQQCSLQYISFFSEMVAVKLWCVKIQVIDNDCNTCLTCSEVWYDN